jgi:hypothetical protein
MLDCFGHFNIFVRLLLPNILKKLRLLGGEICN